MSEAPDHRAVKEQVAERYRAQGYDVDLEKRCDNAMVVDVVAEDEVERVAIEVGAMNGKERHGTLEAMFDRVEHIPLSGREEARHSSGVEEGQVRADVLVDEEVFTELCEFIDERRVQQASKRAYMGEIVDLAYERMENVRERELSDEEYRTVRENINELLDGMNGE